MKDHLQDIVHHTHALGVIDLVKISGDANETAVTSIAEDRSVIVEAKFKSPSAAFAGTFGMPNLGKLNTILNIPEYDADAKISITSKQRPDGTTTPAGIHFENKRGDFKNDYRFMDAEIINDKIKKAIMKQVKWNVDFAPTQIAIQKLKFQASANSEETTFIAKTEDGVLKFFFGDHSSHAGNFVFQEGVVGTLSKAWNWPVTQVIGILGLAGDKTMKISDEGVMQITVDSGLAVYDYKLPAQQK